MPLQSLTANWTVDFYGAHIWKILVGLPNVLTQSESLESLSTVGAGVLGPMTLNNVCPKVFGICQTDGTLSPDPRWWEQYPISLLYLLIYLQVFRLSFPEFLPFGFPLTGIIIF